jgi:long-chain acyl-CoA synthetase
MVTPYHNLVDYLLENAVDSQIALIDNDTPVTYVALIQQMHAIAATLQQASVGVGDKVGIFADNSAFWVASYLATIRLGAVAVPFSAVIAPPHLKDVLDYIDSKVMIFSKRYLRKYAKSIPTDTTIIVEDVTLAGELGITATQIVAAANPIASVHVNTATQLAALMFTSGSTGKPKAVMVSHENIIANTTSIIQYLHLIQQDRILCVLPFYYCFGTSLLHTHLRVGGSLVLSEFWPPVIRKIIEYECTGFAGVPSTYQLLLRNSEIAALTFPTLRYVQQAGGKLAPVFIQELVKALPSTEIFVMYGQTEATARLGYLPPAELQRKAGSIGKAVPGVTLEIVGTEGETLLPQQEGEIVASGASITLGYWKDPDTTAQTYRNGRLHTGDRGYYDEEGYIFITDREKDFIKSSGYRCSSQEIEEHILKLADVLETAVIGIPDEVRGEAIIAFVVLKPGSELTPMAVQQHSRQVMPFYMVPYKVVMIESLPKNEYNKVQKRALREYQLSD